MYTITSNKYQEAKRKICGFAEGADLRLRKLGRDTLEADAMANTPPVRRNGGQSLAAVCVNYLRHNCSAYMELVEKLSKPDGWLSDRFERHVLAMERRPCVAILKRRVLDEISQAYPWLADECVHQKGRDGVEHDPGEYVIPFHPFKGKRLRELETDYLIRLLGRGDVRKSLRTRIERHLAERLVRARQRWQVARAAAERLYIVAREAARGPQLS